MRPNNHHPDCQCDECRHYWRYPSNRAPEPARPDADSVRVQRMDGRRDGACEQERWRVDEWADNRESWYVVEHHDTYREAEAHLTKLMETRAAPTRRWRVVWVRERVQLQSHESPIDQDQVPRT